MRRVGPTVPRTRMTAQYRFAAAALVLVAAQCLVPGSDALAQQPVPMVAPQRPVLRIATGEAPPFILHRGDAPTGFSIDVWNAVAQRLGAQTRFLDLGRRSDDAQLEAVRCGAVRRGEADAAQQHDTEEACLEHEGGKRLVSQE